MDNSRSTQDRLIRHLILVGPRQSVTFEPVRSPGNSPVHQDWHNISTPAPAILKSYPQKSHHKDFAEDVVYFCQPEGCCLELKDAKMHVFMLTDTETNVRTYGVCLTVPHLFDPPTAQSPGNRGKRTGLEVVSIQEWGVLSICVLSRHPFFSFFAKCLKTLSHFMEHFGSNRYGWNDLLRANSSSESEHGKSEPGPQFVLEIENWIHKLIELPIPEEGRVGLEVELEVEPEVLVSYPPKSRLPLFDLRICHIFQKVGVHTLIEIFKLVLSEQKVILCSNDPAFASECVLAVVTLLYPLQYLYPVIPLLPSSMPTAENLLMVPTPYFIGVGDSFMKKVEDFQIAETWVVRVDTRQVKPPPCLDQQQPVLKFPLRILQLQADIRKALDKMQGVGDQTDGNTHSTRPLAIPNSQHSSPSHTFPVLPTLGENDPNSYLFDEVDVSIRIAFVQFLFDPDILGFIDQHLCIYRLFPRPVVALRNAAFLAAYTVSSATADTTFIKELMKTQCVEYFFQYSLNPSNLAFEEIKRGVTEPERLMDKMRYSTQCIETSQVSLYSHSPDSILYQEMVSYKASAGSRHSQDSSDWEVLSGDNYDGDSEHSSLSYYSEGADEEDLTPVASKPKVEEFQKNGIVGVAIQSPDEFEVDYHTPKKFSRSFEEEDTAVPHPAHKMASTPKGGVAKHISPRVNILKPQNLELSSSSEILSCHSAGEEGEDESRLFLTPGSEGKESCSSASDVETGFRQRQPRAAWPSSEREPSVRSAVKRAHTFQDRTAKDASLRRTSLRGEKTGGSAASTPGNTTSPNSHSLELQIQELVSKLMDGQGLPWPKPAYLKRLVYHERSRVTVLRLLEEKLGIREPGEMMLATSEQIIAVAVNKAVFKGVLDLLKYLLQCIEEEVQKEPETCTFSTFLILRIAFSVYLPPKPQKSTIGLSLLNALNLSSFVTSQRTPDESVNGDATPPLDKKVHKLREKELANTRLPTISISDTDEETEELHILRQGKQRGRRGSSPLLTRQSVMDKKKEGLQRSQNTQSSPALLSREKRASSEPLADEIWQKGTEGPDITTLREEEEEEVNLLIFEGGGKSDAESPGPGRDLDGHVCSCQSVEGKSGDIQKADQDGSKEISSSSERKGVQHLERESDGVCPQFRISELSSPPAAHSSSSPITPSPLLGCPPTPLSPPPSTPPPLSQLLPTRLSPLEASVPPSRSSSPTQLRTGALTPSTTPAILLSELINSPRFYHPKEGQDLSGCCFLYKELMKGLGVSRNFLLSRHFWNQLFISTLTVDRDRLGWNEQTAALYKKYNSLSERDKHAFSFEEDSLLSILLHNLLVCMLVVGMTPQETTEIIHRFSARTRLAIMEERMLQQTLKHMEQCIEEDNSDKVDITMLGLMALYSEVHPTISYIVHYGLDVLAPVYKLQITDELLILRRFPDDKICTRLWNDCISIVRYNKGRATVSVCHKDQNGSDYYHHFHTKQYMKVYESLQALVSPGKVESEHSKTSSVSS